MINRNIKFTTGLLTVFISLTCMIAPVMADEYDIKSGGGYSATGQNGDVGYSSTIYDATNGLPTSDANCVLGATDGYVWVGGYSGIMRYDGNSFARLDTVTGLTSGRGMFEDSKGRIWVGTNDNGIVIIDGDDKKRITYKDGLPSSSIRTFQEDREGNIYIGTTAGVCYADTDLKVHPLNEVNLKEERVLKLDRDADGTIYGQTKNGMIFLIKNKQVKRIWTSSELGMEKITTIQMDPGIPGKVYIGTEGNSVYYGQFGEHADNMEKISVLPLRGVHWISYDCNRIWISSINEIGYLDENRHFNLLDDLRMKSGIEMTTSDHQGNIWVASSTQGLMKIVTNDFVDIYSKVGLREEVTNSVCKYKDDLYIGTDNGLKIIGADNEFIQNELTSRIGGARIRCVKRGVEDDLWIGTYTNNEGLLHITSDGNITAFTTLNRMPNNEIRCISPLPDGRTLIGTNGGIAVIKNGVVISSIGPDDGLDNTEILSVEEGDDGSIYVGTDGDGIYVIGDDKIDKITRDDGLTSDVVLRILKDEENGLYWLITSNSIEYLKNGLVRAIRTFPYNNSYDMHPDKNGYMWITSSSGIFRVNTGEMLKDAVSDYRVYTTDNGLSGTPTAQGYCDLDENGFLYVPVRNGVTRVNIDRYAEETVPLKAAISSVYCGDEQILPDAEGTYNIKSSAGRIRITAAVLDYSLLNPLVQVYMEGLEDEGITVSRSSLQPLEYTNLPYGKYTLHIKVLDPESEKTLLDERFGIVKDPRITEMPIIRALFVLIIAFVSGVIVWQVLKKTIIRSQYIEIKRAKDEAERANSAKSRFLANMSHEIRTPINTIMGMNEMAMREDATGVPKPYFMSMMNYAFDVRNATESLLSLINDLLDMSKIESGKMHLVELEYNTMEMLRSIVSMIRVRSNEKELTFDVVVDEMLPSRLYGDQGKIKQIVLNLLTNAVKYTSVGGFALSVSMTERENDECRIEFSVKDTGMGIKEEDMDRLFTAYERLDEQKNSEIQGTGLGLDISRRFAELMGGSLTCESEYGKGSEFKLVLTQKIVDMTPLGIFTEHDEGNAGGPYVPQFVAPDADVLVVDDNTMNLTVIKGLLKGTKVFVSTATSGEECLDKIKDTRFDVVLLDHMMPGMDGIETLAEIRKNNPDLPVYALTANSSAGEEFYKSKGFNGYLSKPIDSLTLEKTIMKHLPEEMMETPAADYIVEELTEIPDNMKWIYETEGIDVSEGIKNSGGVSNYIVGLNMFLDTIEANAKVIRDSYENGNLRLYTIKVHSLKSSAKIIGAMELSKLAESLEDAGNKEDKGFIDANTGKLLSDYEAYLYKLERLQEDEDPADKEMIPEVELKRAYEALSDVIPQMDYDAVEMILDQLKEYALPEEDDRKIKELSKMHKVFDWDGMEKLISG